MGGEHSVDIDSNPVLVLDSVTLEVRSRFGAGIFQEVTEVCFLPYALILVAATDAKMEPCLLVFDLTENSANAPMLSFPMDVPAVSVCPVAGNLYALCELNEDIQT